MRATISFPGRMAVDPEWSEVNGTDLCKFRVAVDQYRGRNKEGDAGFFPCEVWGGLSKFMNGVRKGDAISVWGKMVQDHFTNKSGEKRSTWKVKVDALQTPDTRDRKSSGRGDSTSAPKVSEPGEDDQEDLGW